MRILISLCLLLAFLTFLPTVQDDMAADKAVEMAQSGQKKKLGDLVSMSVESSWWYGDKTTLVVSDGTQVRLRGGFSIVKVGMAVEVPVAQISSSSTVDTVYCLADKCLPLLRN